ncbi:hypothetical protein [Vibrio alginolyticus]|nr:hypothetical protein [Vibrio alginolyticus]
MTASDDVIQQYRKLEVNMIANTQDCSLWQMIDGNNLKSGLRRY